LQTKNTQSEEHSREQHANKTSNIRIAESGIDFSSAPPAGGTRSSGLKNSGSKGPLSEVLEKRLEPGSPRRLQKRYNTERQRILAFVEDFAREFNDQAPLSSSISRAYNLWHRSGMPIEAFSSFMYEARALTNEFSARVRKTDDKSSAWGPQKNKMAYSFAILEQLVDQHSPNGAASESKRGNGHSDIAGADRREGDETESSQTTLSEPSESPRTAGSSSRRLSGPSAKKRSSNRDEDSLWEAIRSSLTDLNPAHEQWLRSAQGCEQNGQFVLAVADPKAKAFIEARLMPAIKRALEHSGRSDLKLEVTV
jgi:hypothetical protein